MTLNKIRHSGIVVLDMDSAIPFYRDVLGMVVYWDQVEDWAGLARAFKLPKVSVRTVKMSPDPTDNKYTGIELLQFSEPSHSKSVGSRTLQSLGCTHLAIQVGNLDLVRSRLIEKKFDFIAEPEMSPDGNVRLAFCNAPEEVFLELVEVQK